MARSTHLASTTKVGDDSRDRGFNTWYDAKPPPRLLSASLATGQLGLGDRFTREAPVRVTALEGHRVVRVAAGQQHAAAVTDGGKLFTWGGGTFGIGHGDVHDLLTPRQVEGRTTLD